jgi:excisionase family DNA binding protein
MSTVRRKPGRPAPPRPAPVDATPASLPPDELAAKSFLSTTAVAKRLGVAVQTVHNLVHRKELPAIRVGSKLMISTVGLERFIAQGGSAQKK